MATGFTYVSYTTDAGTVGRIRMSSQAQGFTGQGSLTATLTDPNLFVTASNPGSKRKKRLHARGVVLARTVGTAPNTFSRKTFVPITTKAALDALVVGAAVAAYGGQAWTIFSKIGEV
jgi:hypothetical protein